MRRRSKVIIGLLTTGLLVAAVSLLSIVRYGFSAHDEPTRLEALVARTVRRWAVPSDLHGARNPIPVSSEVLAEARAHFADHCAVCHGNDGKGQNGLGKQMYPRTPDMTFAATQSLSDGELFSIIENGIRLTGMPAFGSGTAESARGSWALVHFIRHFPKITPEEVAEMEKLNPKSPEEWQAMQSENDFLNQDETGSAEATSETTQHKH